MRFFLTFTCNQSKHLGIKELKYWLDNGEWRQSYQNWNELNSSEKKEIERSINQVVAPLILRNWMEVRKTVLRLSI